MLLKRVENTQYDGKEIPHKIAYIYRYAGGILCIETIIQTEEKERKKKL